MKIGVVGLGLIGGSIFKALSSSGKYNVLGVSSSVVEENVSKDYNSLKDCDLVFVCTPMNVTIAVLDKLENILPETTIVTDVCSIKGFVSKKKYAYKFIPSHPMAGTEKSGWENSFAELFEGAKWAITPLEGTLKEDLVALESVINNIGAKVVIATPEAHDEAVALISHMPMVVTQALCENIKENKLAQELAASGFRDTTRLALSNLEMANDMVKMNYENISKSLELLQSNLKSLLEEEYSAKAKQIQEFRRTLY